MEKNTERRKPLVSLMLMTIAMTVFSRDKYLVQVTLD
jgi:hypothetical protein